MEALHAEPDPHTTVAEPEAALDRHVADSLTGLAVPAVAAATRVADLGAGAGFPGLPLAIACPHAEVDLIESARRKTDLISRLARAAAVPNASPVNARAEDWAKADGRGAYDLVTARALAPLAVILEYAAPLLELSGTVVAWKGARDPDEERVAEKAAELLGLEPGATVRVRPFKGSRDRHLHTYVKASPTPSRFPRRAGMAAKRPLPG